MELGVCGQLGVIVTSHVKMVLRHAAESATVQHRVMGARVAVETTFNTKPALSACVPVSIVHCVLVSHFQ